MSGSDAEKLSLIEYGIDSKDTRRCVPRISELFHFATKSPCSYTMRQTFELNTDSKAFLNGEGETRLKSSFSVIGLAECWSFSNVATSIDKLIRPQNDTSKVLNGSDGAISTASPEVTVQGRIIFVPRRNKVLCQPGQQVDRRGKCRTIW
ncbi:Uncharacterized protein DBV15_09322 [Temnothorax longispinosus]|uniref:Uncharacterized protein n=1 Tax=Temnothorax longispinosus TaxID=300112 RepID=A0A4S2KJZ4_9HYME|nr:Uncharacterized protein DBV15_09322 [Temnothorax longispinosus]